MYVWYNKATRGVIHLSEPAFTETPPSMEGITQVPDGPLPGLPEWLRVTSTLDGLEVDPSKVPPPRPNWTGFLMWMPTVFTPAVLNAFAKAYPSMVGFCQFGNAQGVQWCITDGKVNLPLTTDQYALFQGANTTYNLGMTLP